MKKKTTILPDNKWRLRLPKEYCDKFLENQNVVYLFRVNDMEYVLYDKAYFENTMIPKILNKKFDNKEKLRAFRRVVFAHTYDLDVDAHNRIVIPQMYRTFLNGDIQFEMKDNGLVLYGKTNADSGPKGGTSKGVDANEKIIGESDKENEDERE